MLTIIRSCILIIMLLLAPASAWAIHPFEVEDTNTQGKGNLLLELNDDYSKDSGSKTTKESGIITVGASEHIDFSLDVPYLKLDPSPVTDGFASGVGDVRMKFKQRLFENEVKQSMAYELYGDLPTGDHLKGLGTNNVIWGVAVMDQQECRNKVLRANVAYEIPGRDLKHIKFTEEYALRFGVAFEDKLTTSFRLLAEIEGESRRFTDQETGARTNSRPATVMAGFIYDITRYWYIDAGVRAGLNKYAPDYTGLAGTAFRF
jgi:outer membrane putative beta-barrel porin/alpha-amylase